MVRAAQKGEGASSPEVAKVADEISNKDAKKFAKTKHKGLPEIKEGKEKLKGRHPRDQKELDRAQEYIKKNPKFGLKEEESVPRNSVGKPIRIKDKIKAAKGQISQRGVKEGTTFEIDKSAHKAAQKKTKMRNLARNNENPNEKAAAEKKAGGPKLVGEGIGRAAIGAGVGSMVAGPVGAAVGASIGASLGKKKVTTGNGGKKKPTNFFKPKSKVTTSEEIEMKESVLDVVRKFSKKKKEKQPQKAMDAGARAKRLLQRKEYASKISGSTDNVPDNIRDHVENGS